jgi:hypothetical protein
MFRNILLLIFLIGTLIICSCKKESHCTDMSAYYQNKYILRDSIVYPHDSVVIIPDTITFNPIPNSGGKCFINYIGPESTVLLANGCANSFTIDTSSTGIFMIYFGKGSFSANGQQISLVFERVPSPYYPSDTVYYYCSGFKQ